MDSFVYIVYCIGCAVCHQKNICCWLLVEKMPLTLRLHIYVDTVTQLQCNWCITEGITMICAYFIMYPTFDVIQKIVIAFCQIKIDSEKISGNFLHHPKIFAKALSALCALNHIVWQYFKIIFYNFIFSLKPEGIDLCEKYLPMKMNHDTWINKHLVIPFLFCFYTNKKNSTKKLIELRTELFKQRQPL